MDRRHGPRSRQPPAGVERAHLAYLAGAGPAAAAQYLTKVGGGQ